MTTLDLLHYYKKGLIDKTMFGNTCILLSKGKYPHISFNKKLKNGYEVCLKNPFNVTPENVLHIVRTGIAQSNLSSNLKAWP